MNARVRASGASSPDRASSAPSGPWNTRATGIATSHVMRPYRVATKPERTPVKAARTTAATMSRSMELTPGG